MEMIHNRFQHASANEMKNLLKANLEGLEKIQAMDIDNWYQERGQFCSGCVEGKMKEHARVKSTKPLIAQAPGDITVGDIMFVEIKNSVKKTLMTHVDVYTKMIIGVPLNNKTEAECTSAKVSIHLIIREKARATKAGVRSKYGLPTSKPI